MIEERICDSWLAVQDSLYLDSWDARLERHRSSFAFRGTSAASPLTTSLQRLGGDYAQVELPLLRTFIKYAYAHVALASPGLLLGPPGNSQWNWLVLARHHGLPTRLLDWTYSPYIALHFATAHLQDHLPVQDSVIWCVDYTKVHAFLPEWLRAPLHEEQADVFTVEMLARVVPDLSTLDAKLQHGKGSLPAPEALLFFESLSLDERIVNQFPLLSVLSGPTASLEHWLEAHPELCRKIVLPAHMLWEIRDKLDQAGIHERLLYPGLDGLCRWLQRYYAPRSPGDRG